MIKMYFHPNRYRIVNFNKDDIKRTGITHSLILSNEDETGNQRASGIIDNPSDIICKKVKNAFENNKLMKCYIIGNNSSVTKLKFGNEEFNF